MPSSTLAFLKTLHNWFARNCFLVNLPDQPDIPQHKKKTRPCDGHKFKETFVFLMRKRETFKYSCVIFVAATGSLSDPTIDCFFPKPKPEQRQHPNPMSVRQNNCLGASNTMGHLGRTSYGPCIFRLTYRKRCPSWQPTSIARSPNLRICIWIWS